MEAYVVLHWRAYLERLRVIEEVTRHRGINRRKFLAGSAALTGGVGLPNIGRRGLAQGIISTLTIADRAQLGYFEQPRPLEVVPVHVAVGPNRQVTYFGTNQIGDQGAGQWYAKLNTRSGTSAIFANNTGVDRFCSSVGDTYGKVWTATGDLTINGGRNNAQNETTDYTWANNQLVIGSSLSIFPRWYASAIPLSNGDTLICGGNDAQGGTLQITPEIRTPSGAFVALYGATNADAFGQDVNWWYPRGSEIPGTNGKIGLLTNEGTIYLLDPNANTGTDLGSIEQIFDTGNPGDYTLPFSAIRPGVWMGLRANDTAMIVTWNGEVPSVQTQSLSVIDQGLVARSWSNLTVLPDGNVLINGGSFYNSLTDVAYQSIIYNPDDGLIRVGPSALVPRLYHSVAFLDEDAYVWTGGGGSSSTGPDPTGYTLLQLPVPKSFSPTPNGTTIVGFQNPNGWGLIEANSERWVPYYLFNAAGFRAQRPIIINDQQSNVTLGTVFTLELDTDAPVTAITAVRKTVTTHSFNTGQSFIKPSFMQAGGEITVGLPSDQSVMMPGSWMVYAWRPDPQNPNPNSPLGVPSSAKCIDVYNLA